MKKMKKIAKKLDNKSIAMKIANSYGTMAKESLVSGLTGLKTGRYVYVKSTTDIINGNSVALALWAKEDGKTLSACGASKFAIHLGAVGRDAQQEVLNSEDLKDTLWDINVEGTGRDRVITFKEVE